MARRRKNVKGYIYLIHFHIPFKHARHYTGWAKNVDDRLAERIEGSAHSSKLCKAATAAGCRLEIARIWKDKTRNDERQMKLQGGASRRCPLCIMEKKDK